ncbi:MAG: BMP family ABC transporter substrate-binding protein [Pseudobutyrivibrio sp.]|nr:BMP family ABC transporter substrate-binding protein [Pseudobutyrivibrio sp.]
MKKTKRIIAILTAATMIGSMVGCGAVGKETETSNEDNVETSANLSSDLKIGFIFLHDENSTYDLNFINAAKEACEAAGVEYVFKTGVPEGQECYDAACELADSGCDIVFADSFGHEDYLLQAAKEYEDVQFCHATGTQAHTAGLDNFHNAFATIYEGRYLAGITAGMKLNEMIESGEITEDEAKMGYVGAFTYAEVISGYTAFYLGAKSVCPSVTMEVTFTGSWYDETAEKEGANTLIQDGCVLISQHADSMGAPTACETAGVYDVSYNGSTAEACPNTFLVSSRINWVPYFSYIIDCAENGEPIATDYTGDLSTGSVELTEFGSACAEGTEEAVEAAKAELEAGTLHVFDVTTFTVEGEELTSYMADVDTDADYTPDHEAVVDGYFAESSNELRSAPFFDILVDGITLHDTAF